MTAYELSKALHNARQELLEYEKMLEQIKYSIRDTSSMLYGYEQKLLAEISLCKEVKDEKIVTEAELDELATDENNARKVMDEHEGR